MPTRRPVSSAIWRLGARLVEPAYLTVISVFILLPLLILFPVSFSSADVLIFPPPGYSLRWFEAILSSPEWIAAALTSLRIGAVTCILSLLLATLAVLGFGRHRFLFQGALEAIVQSPPERASGRLRAWSLPDVRAGGAGGHRGGDHHRSHGTHLPRRISRGIRDV